MSYATSDKRIEALKDERRQLISAKQALERRIDELCQENERLRNQLHDQQDTAGHNFVRNAREYKRVCDENARLRKLFSSYWKAVHSPATPNVPRDYLKEMRNLGIEVPS